MDLLVIGNYIKGDKIKSVSFNLLVEEGFREGDFDKVIINKETGYKKRLIDYYKSVQGNLPNQIIVIKVQENSVMKPYTKDSIQSCVPEIFVTMYIK